MRLENAARHSLELHIVDLEPPTRHGDDRIPRWLVIEGHVVHPDGPWSFRDACITTSEWQHFAAWLSGFGALHRRGAWELEFLEPNLLFTFEATRDRDRLRVYFEAECRPPGRQDAEIRSNDIYVDFEPTPAELKEAARALTAELEAWPARGRWG